MTLSERLVQLVDALADGNRKAFSARIGVATNTYKSWIQRGIMEADKILAACPEISSEWLVAGRGPMFVADIEIDRSLALATLGITEEQLATLRQPTVNHAEGETRLYAHAHTGVHPLNNEQPSPAASSPGQPSPDSTSPYRVAEGEAVDRALLNMLLAEKAQLLQKLSVLEARNLKLEKDNAVLEARFAGATEWYYSAITKHPDLK